MTATKKKIKPTQSREAIRLLTYFLPRAQLESVDGGYCGKHARVFEGNVEAAEELIEAIGASDA